MCGWPLRPSCTIVGKEKPYAWRFHPIVPKQSAVNS